MSDSEASSCLLGLTALRRTQPRCPALRLRHEQLRRIRTRARLGCAARRIPLRGRGSPRFSNSKLDPKKPEALHMPETC